LEAGKAETKAEIQAVQAEKADLEAKVAAQEERIDALENDNAHLESMKAGSVCAPFLFHSLSQMGFLSCSPGQGAGFRCHNK
jgi:hypothetical protein